MNRACVIGWPISHSRSPLIHNYWLERYSIQGRYDRLPIEPSKLSGFLSELPTSEYFGCNITLPHKERAFRLVDQTDEIAQRLGVVNTIYRRGGKLLGTSTDGEGFVANLTAVTALSKLKNQRAVVFGAGGAAMAVVGALVDLGLTEIAIANRTIERSNQLRKIFGKMIVPIEWADRSEALAECHLFVNSTSLGMTGQPALNVNLARLPTSAVVADLVYSPLQTPLLVAALSRGNVATGGMGMLLHQAVRGFELWFGTRPKVTKELYDLVARDINPSYLS